MMEEFKPVVFRLGERKFGVDISRIQGIEKDQRVVPVPNTEEYITGIMNLRGQVIPVYNLKKKFNIPESNSIDKQYIIAWAKSSTLALEVDGVEEIHNVGSENIHNVPSIIGTGDTKYLQSVIHIKDDLIIIINIDDLLTEAELSRVEELVKNA